MSQQLNHISKLMSLVLRHQPEKIGLQLDAHGWTPVQALIDKLLAKGIAVNEALIQTIVATNDKQRFALNDDKTMIRASQGHSIDVALNLPESMPPNILYHGTTGRFLNSIRSNGLQKQNRQHVHLSATVETAVAVGSRHGKPVVLHIQAKAMFDEGYKFYLSDNKVWLTDFVPIAYITQ
ncbi:MAG: RNA 2'-phosphotransferase [Chitinophagaceae bacterium]